MRKDIEVDMSKEENNEERKRNRRRIGNNLNSGDA